MTKLYVNTGWTSPYALAAFVALTEKGIPFECVEMDLEAGEHKKKAFADASGTVRIPMLDHDGFRLTESSAICEYLDEAFPGGVRLYPSDTKARAHARQIQAWVRSDLMAIRMERGTEHVWFDKKMPPLTDKAAEQAAKLHAFTDSLLTDGAEHLFGAWSIADTDLAVMLMRLVLNGDEVPARIADYARGQWARPSLAAWRAASKR